MSPKYGGILSARVDVVVEGGWGVLNVDLLTCTKEMIRINSLKEKLYPTNITCPITVLLYQFAVF